MIAARQQRRQTAARRRWQQRRDGIASLSWRQIASRQRSGAAARERGWHQQLWRRLYLKLINASLAPT